ncbi:MAG: hypothetical protein A2521_13675 [Deltaproteobacteria bacterium RIFOXYD12_FULL_57_12]|nr:MAG: hypothetical protein A2521_13675 [Deltaproteobacteria bacterium RIFOXYD12_FULL_57_12]
MGTDQLLVGQGEYPVNLLARRENLYGLISEATGTGKTVSLMVLRVCIGVSLSLLKRLYVKIFG